MPLRVARVTKVHGLKGAVRLDIFTDDPSDRFVPGRTFFLEEKYACRPELDHADNALVLEKIHWHNTILLAFFKGIPDRRAAERLVGASLWIAQHVDETPEEKNAWYDYQLFGLEVYSDQERIGRIERLEHFPAQDLLVIAYEQENTVKEIFLPFIEQFVPLVDVESGYIRVEMPEGLLDL